MEPHDQIPRIPDNPPPIDPAQEQVRYLGAQVEALQEALARLHGSQNIAVGAVRAPRRRSWLLALIAVILATGAVAFAVLVAAGYLLHQQPPAKPPQVNIAVQPADDTAPAAVIADTATPRPTVPPATATPQPTQTALPTSTPVASDTPMPVDTATAVPANGVSVCTDADYDKPDVLCNQSDGSFTQDTFYQARLVFTGPNGGTFAHSAVLILLSTANSEGSWTSLGTMPDTVPVADTSRSWDLSEIFSSTGVVPAFDGSTYQIEVDSGDASLGSATFSLSDGTSLPTATAVPMDTSTPASVTLATAYTATDACAGAMDAVDAVVRFYWALTLQQYSAAYACLDPAWQEGTSFSSFVAGYATTVSNRLVLANSLPGNRVWIDLHAVDHMDGKLVARSFTGEWQVNSDLRLHLGTISVLSTSDVTSIPPTDHAAIFQFDNRIVLRNLHADVTGPGASDEVFLTKDSSCASCQKRNVWVYHDGVLVYAEAFWHGATDIRPAVDGSGFTVDTPDTFYVYQWTPAGFLALGHD